MAKPVPIEVVEAAVAEPARKLGPTPPSVLDAMLFLTSGGLAREGAVAPHAERHAQFLVAMMEHPCQAIVRRTGRQCRHAGYYERDGRDICGVHLDVPVVTFVAPPTRRPPR